MLVMCWFYIHTYIIFIFKSTYHYSYIYIYPPNISYSLYFFHDLVWGVFNVNCGKGLIIPWISPPSPILPMISPYDWWYPHWNLKPIKLWWLLNYIMLDDVLIIIISPWYTNKDHHIYIYMYIHIDIHMYVYTYTHMYQYRYTYVCNVM